jgi:anti-sigma B factor antagonist
MGSIVTDHGESEDRYACAALEARIRRRADGILVMQLIGTAGSSGLDALSRATMQATAARPCCIVVDLAQLDLLSSLAIGILVEVRRSIIAHGGRVHLAAARGVVAETLQLAGLDRLFAVHSSVEGATTA